MLVVVRLIILLALFFLIRFGHNPTTLPMEQLHVWIDDIMRPAPQATYSPNILEYHLSRFQDTVCKASVKSEKFPNTCRQLMDIRHVISALWLSYFREAITNNTNKVPGFHERILILCIHDMKPLTSQDSTAAFAGACFLTRLAARFNSSADTMPLTKWLGFGIEDVPYYIEASEASHCSAKPAAVPTGISFPTALLGNQPCGAQYALTVCSKMQARP